MFWNLGQLTSCFQNNALKLKTIKKLKPLYKLLDQLVMLNTLYSSIPLVGLKFVTGYNKKKK